LDVYTNPFRNGSQIKDKVPRFPDGMPNSIPLCVTCTAEIAAATTTSGYIYVCPPAADNLCGVRLVYGNDPLIDAQQPTTTVAYNWRESPLLASYTTVAHYAEGYRVVGGGLKLQFSGALTTGGGSAQGGHWEDDPLYYTGPLYGLYGHVNARLQSETYQIRDGVTVRWMQNNTSKLIQDAPATSLVSIDHRFGLLPMIRFTGLTAGSTIMIRAVLYLEARALPAIIPYSTSGPVSEPDLSSIVAYGNSQPLISKGNSFHSIFRDAAQGIRAAFRFIEERPLLRKAIIAGLETIF
jgi:hypothetical protein